MSDRPDEHPADLTRLPRERIPPADLEDRTVAALRRRGLLSGSRRRPAWPAWPAWSVAAAAAAAALFAAGFSIGQARGARQTVEVVEALREADAARTAALIQRAGSDYVAALAALAESAGAGDSAPGREVARGVVRTALTELARQEPDDAEVRRALAALSPAPGEASDSTARSVRATLWF